MAARREPMGENRTGCSRCRIGRCPLAPCPSDPVLAGWRLTLASLWLFLGPVVLAIVGAMMVGEDRGAQLLGAMIGMSMGMLGSIFARRLLRREDKKAG